MHYPHDSFSRNKAILPLNVTEKKDKKTVQEFQQCDITKIITCERNEKENPWKMKINQLMRNFNSYPI